MIKRELFIGFVTGIIANALGTLLYILIFSENKVIETIKIAKINGYLGSLFALGAILNLIVFFIFLRFNKDMRAKGVLMATILSALVSLAYKIL
ncbi:hypothetical protein [Leptobacterium sp. I13]|uniref:hypothetical protein n=1 Tax=Leptobacterium meishanense TaxID=3128904 RepID=UPI0030ED5E06